MTVSLLVLESTPRLLVVFLQECLIGPIVKEPGHCGLQKEGGGLETRAILEEPHNVYIAPTLHPVLSLLDHTGNTMQVESGWMLKETQRCISMKV